MNSQHQNQITNRRNTRQRRVVLDAVRGLEGNHPTADMVYDRVRIELPRISLSTVYRNLGILAEQGEIIPVRAAGLEVHYDSRTEDHCHAQCRLCGKVLDIFLDTMDLATSRSIRIEGFDTEKVIVTLVGTCAECGGAVRERRETK